MFFSLKYNQSCLLLPLLQKSQVLKVSGKQFHGQPFCFFPRKEELRFSPGLSKDNILPGGKNLPLRILQNPVQHLPQGIFPQNEICYSYLSVCPHRYIFCFLQSLLLIPGCRRDSGISRKSARNIWGTIFASRIPHISHRDIYRSGLYRLYKPFLLPHLSRLLSALKTKTLKEA